MAHIQEETQNAFKEFRLSKGEFQDKKLLVLKTEDDSNVLEVDNDLTNNCSTLDDLKQMLPDNESRYIYYLVHFERPSKEKESVREGERTKMISIVWNPTRNSIKNKFLTAGTCEYLRNTLPGIFFTIQASNTTQFNDEKIVKECLKLMN